MDHDFHTLSNEQWLDNFHRYLLRRFSERSTPEHYLSDLNIFCRSCSHKPLALVDKNDIDSFIDDQLIRGYAPSTRKRRAASLKTFFDFLLEELQLPLMQNPVSMRRHAGKQPKLLPRDLKDAQVALSVKSIIVKSQAERWMRENKNISFL